MEKVKSLEKYVGNGVTEPIWAKLTSNELVVLKYPTNIQGKKILFNEIVCYLMAKKLNVNMPQSGICIIDKDTFCTDLNLNKLYADNINKCCFFSKALEKGVNLNIGIIRDIENKEQFEKVLLFDHIIYNTDRNCGNILANINKTEKKIYIIDHTHVFKNQTIWDRYCFEQGMKNKDYMDTDIINNNKYYYDMFFRAKNITKDTLLESAKIFCTEINSTNIDEIFQSIPKEWLVNSEDMNMLKKYLLYRTNHIEDIIKVILRYKN